MWPFHDELVLDRFDDPNRELLECYVMLCVMMGIRCVRALVSMNSKDEEMSVSS